MWRCRDIVQDWYLGGQRKSFHMILALLDRMKFVDLGCIVDWSTHEDNKIFQRTFVCPSATKKSLHHCQLVIFVDVYHTKNKRYPYQLFIVTVLDGNM